MDQTAAIQTNAPPIFDIDALADYQKEAMCRVITNGIRRLLNDERNRADFEQWKNNKDKRRTQNDSKNQV